MIKIAVDAMGGDFAPKEQVEGAMLAIKNIDDIEITLYGDEKAIYKYLTNTERIKVVPSEGTIDMGEKDPIRAIRNNRKSSMALALSSVRSGDNDGVVSSGATQALIAGAHILVGRMKQMKRTAIAPLIPTINGGSTILLDAGGNIEIKPEYMLNQAYFAHVYAQDVLGVKEPKIGLINIGTEPGKGRQLDKEAFELFKNDSLLDFVGNVEPKEVLDPPCDILISDGFTANIVMKTVEGTAKGMGKLLKQKLKKGILGKIGLLFSARNLKSFKKAMSAEEIGGAMIYGLKGVVVKAQGSSRANGFYNGIRQAALICRKDVLNKVKTHIEEMVE
ncbi:Phosphate acyltransferase [Candidatus Izimaplasma bacterium HR1]|jgi:glycerol-3-phosphate acyltransferase PlsX|uniref:phosphate acyltransferase PlsX n=1 Tax=Candidatus Izimoplasma sp. HR1 TaxID=1541959 RepID=UPI0004F67525|nr:Phosphate acyltransferase [Candidatus Izimaplasma bacterium HR1]